MNLNRRCSLLRLARLGLFLFAWALLLFRLNDVPPGFQHDQTFTSLDAFSVLRGHLPIYFAANFGREPLFMYSVAGVFGLTGGHYVWSLHFTSVLWGILGLATTLLLARRYLSEGAALFAGAMMTASFWFLFAARLGLEPIALLPLASGFLYLLLRGLDRPSFRVLALAGLVGGIAIYTYLAARTLFLLIPLLMLYEGVVWLRARRSAGGRSVEQRRLAGLLLGLAVMLAVSAPLLVYLAGHSGSADGRLRELGGPLASVLRGDLGPLFANALDTVRSILWAGSQALPYQYNIPGRPVLQPLLALFFMIGLISTVARLWERREYLLLVALFLGLAPSLLTGADALHMRGIIVLPILFILTARGIWTISSGISKVLPGKSRSVSPEGRSKLLSIPAGVLVAGLLVWHAGDSGTAYFGRWAGAEETQRIYNADFRAAARYLDEAPDQGQVFIGTDRLLDLDSRTYRFYEPNGADVEWFELPYNPPLPAEGKALFLIPSSARMPPALALLTPAADERVSLPAQTGGVDLIDGLRLSADGIERELAALGVRPAGEKVSIGDALRLDALGYVDDGAQAELITRWTVLAPWPRSARPGYLLPRPKIALSLVDRAGTKWAQSDVVTALPVETWRPGQVVVERTPFSIPADLLPGEYGVQLVLYDDEGGALPIRTADGETVAAPPIVGQLSIPAGDRGEAPAPLIPALQSQEGGGLRALGSWEAPERLIAGVPTDLHVSWQALQPLKTSGLHFRLKAVSADGSLLWEQPADPVTPLPELWPAGQVYRLTHRLFPAASQPGQVSVSLELCAEQAGEESSCAVVGQPTVISRQPAFELATAPQHTSGARWDDVLTLAGYELKRVDRTVNLTLYWQVEEAPAVPLKRFVHAVDPAGGIVAQADAFLESDGVPAVYWQPGEYIADRIELVIPAGGEMGSLYVGFYDPDTGERLPVSSASGEALPDGRLQIDLQDLP